MIAQSVRGLRSFWVGLGLNSCWGQIYLPSLLCISTSIWMLGAPESWSKHFFELFSSLFSDFMPEIKKKHLKTNITKKVENKWKNCFDQLSGARSTWKLVEIHNTSQKPETLCSITDIWRVKMDPKHSLINPLNCEDGEGSYQKLKMKCVKHI